MKLLKNAALVLFMAVASVGVSSTAMAENDPGRVTFTPQEAIGNVVDKIHHAEAAIASNKSADEVAAIVKEAKDLGKEINANDKVDRARSKATNHLVAALKTLKSKNPSMTEAEHHLKAAGPAFTELKSLI